MLIRSFREQFISVRLCSGASVSLCINTILGTTCDLGEFGGSVKKLWLGELCFLSSPFVS